MMPTESTPSPSPYSQLGSPRPRYSEKMKNSTAAAAASRPACPRALWMMVVISTYQTGHFPGAVV